MPAPTEVKGTFVRHCRAGMTLRPQLKDFTKKYKKSIITQSHIRNSKKSILLNIS